MKTAVLAVVAVVAASTGGCAQRPVPKEIVTRPETGEWTIVCDPNADHLPATIPIVTIKDGARHAGLLLVPGTTGYSAILPLGRPAGTFNSTYLQLPVLVKPSPQGWQIDVRQRVLPASLVASAEKTPLSLLIPIDPPGAGRPVQLPRLGGEGRLVD